MLYWLATSIGFKMSRQWSTLGSQLCNSKYGAKEIDLKVITLRVTGQDCGNDCINHVSQLFLIDDTYFPS